jgi:hypothetical protein
MQPIQDYAMIAVAARPPLDLIIIAVISVGVAVLAVSLGKWKIKMGLLPRFKSLTMPRHRERSGIS